MESEQPNDDKWSKRFLDVLDDGIAFVRDRTTLPLVKIVRGTVFGTFAVLGAALVFVFSLIALFRGVNELLDLWWSRETAVWASYLLIGGIFLLIGGRLMRRRTPRD